MAPGTNVQFQPKKTTIQSSFGLSFLVIGKECFTIEFGSDVGILVMQALALTCIAQGMRLSLQAMYRFNIASSFAIDEQVSYAELGKRCGLGESDTKRLIRLAIAHRIFCEPQKDLVAHTAMSKLLVQVPTLHQWNCYVIEEMSPASTRTIDAIMMWPESEEPNHTGFALAKGVNSAFFDKLGKNQERADRFAAVVHVMQGSPMLKSSFLLDSLG